jgi:hypothetical protein
VLDRDTELFRGLFGFLGGQCVEERWISSVDEAETVSVFAGQFEVEVVYKGAGTQLAPAIAQDVIILVPVNYGNDDTWGKEEGRWHRIGMYK